MESLIASSPRKRRPNYPVGFKKSLAQQATQPGVSVSQLAQQHGINANMLFKWRRELIAGVFDQCTGPVVMLPVALSDGPVPMPVAARAPVTEGGTARQGLIELRIGGAALRFDGHADLAMLQAVVQMLRA